MKIKHLLITLFCEFERSQNQIAHIQITILTLLGQTDLKNQWGQVQCCPYTWKKKKKKKKKKRNKLY